MAEQDSIGPFYRAAEKLQRIRPELEALPLSEFDELLDGLRDMRDLMAMYQAGQGDTR
jgi:hypothetical protein